MTQEIPIKASAALLTPKEAAALLGVSVVTIRRRIAAGMLKAVKTAEGQYRVRRSELKKSYGLTLPVHDDGREGYRRLSGRNQLIGIIVEIKINGLLAKVVLQIGPPLRAQRITAIITADAVREMKLRKGQIAGALMKSTEVMITRF